MRKLKFNITKKLALTYLVIIFVAIITTVSCINSLVKYQELDNEFVFENLPSIEKLKEIQYLSAEINKLAKSWVFISSQSDKDKLQRLLKNAYPLSLNKLNAVSKKYTLKEDIDAIKEINKHSEEAILNINKNAQLLNGFEAYFDEKIVNQSVDIYYEKINVNFLINDKIFAELLIRKTARQEAIFKNKEALISYLNFIFLTAIILIVLISFISIYFTKKKISNPLIVLEKIISNVSIGDVQTIPISKEKDEIGDMQNALSKMIDGLKEKISFAKDIGNGNYKAEVNLLSDHDQLGYSLIDMALDLQQYDKNIKESKAIVETQRNEILDSIDYSLHIQQSLIPSDAMFEKTLKDSFMFFRPKDIVSGDFPWLFETKKFVYFGVVDCIGHGVPGAMMSMIGILLLNSIIQNGIDNISPSEILAELHKEVVKTLKQNSKENSKDGMDASLCRLDYANKEILFSGAHLPLVLLRGDKLEIFKGDRFNIGGLYYQNKNIYTDHIIKLQKGDKIFIFSDGLIDQIGGVEKKKWMTSNFKEFILENKDISMSDFKQKVSSKFDEFKGNCKQIDDVLLIGVEI